MSQRAFEMRIYHAVPGRMEALHARFRDHTCDLFARHEIGIVGFWSAQDVGRAIHPILVEGQLEGHPAATLYSEQQRRRPPR